MNDQTLQTFLQNLADGKISVEKAMERFRSGLFHTETLEYATLDHHRILRLGICEVIYAEGKTIDQLLTIAVRLSEPNNPVLITRIQPEFFPPLQNHFPQGRTNLKGRTFIIHPPGLKEVNSKEPFVAIISGGTSDYTVVEEAAEVCVAMDVPFKRVYDIGVAGIHRLFHHLPEIETASSLVVIAGMEGALPSVIGGLVKCPVFAVPTSIGYGTSFQGLAALLAMLNSCAPGISVTNIDNGFSAAFAACKVVKQIQESVLKANSI